MSKVDWSGVERDVLDRIVGDGQAYLDGQIRLATAADQRASSLAGIFTAAGTALIAGLIALASVSAVHHAYPPYAAGSVSAAMFLIAAGLCVLSTFPIGMWLPGSQPEAWFPDIREKKEFNLSLAQEAENIQDKIDENRSTIERNAKFFKWGAVIGLCSPVAGLLVWLLTSAAYWV